MGLLVTGEAELLVLEAVFVEGEDEDMVDEPVATALLNVSQASVNYPKQQLQRYERSVVY